MKMHKEIVELLTLHQSTIGMYSIVGYNDRGNVVHRKRDLRLNDVLEILFALNKRKRDKIRVFGDVTYQRLDEYVKPAIDILE